MPRAATGNVYESRGRWYARVIVAKGKRPSIPLPTCSDEGAASARLAILAKLAGELRAAGQSEEIAVGFLERAGAKDGKALEAVLRAGAAVCAGEAGPKRDAAQPGKLSPETTFQDLGELWTGGALHRLHPDHVKKKTNAESDVSYLERHVYPIVGAVRIVNFTLDHAETVMRAVPSTLAPMTRVAILQAMHRVLSIAVFPLRLIAAHPIPPHFRPSKGAKKARGWLYPDEDAKLLASPAVALCWRVLYGFLHREGPRSAEAKALTWKDLDLERGVLTLDENKTDDPRAWALSPGVVAAFRAWKSLRKVKDDAEPVFVADMGGAINDDHLAKRFRAHLRAAGVTRAALFESTSSRMRIRLHDTRATFVTISLANGKTEAWVQDRTGHRSSTMINVYRRAARTAAELGLGDLAPLDQAIPELAG